MPNPKHGLPTLHDQELKPFRSAPFLDGIQKVYWAHTQPAFDDFSPFSTHPATPYEPPSGWPVPGELLRLPKVVRFMHEGPGAGVASAPYNYWREVVASVQSQVEALSSNVSVTAVPSDLAGPFAHLAPPLGTQFLGTDVLWIIVLFARTGGGMTGYFQPRPFANVEPTDLYLIDQARIAAAYESYRRFRVVLHNDVGQPGDSDNFGILNKTDWQNFCINCTGNTGPYSDATGLGNYGWEYGGTASWGSTGAAPFVSLIRSHFEI